ncbi:hypothetical protein OAS39_13030 [Pirellulales bacterium]|nr:hypothetical protein [Pirellulales bacterium]
MRLKLYSRSDLLLVLLVISLPAGWLVSEARWSRINNPNGKFTNVDDYLAQSRQPNRVTKVSRDGKSYFIAYGPLDGRWLAMPSGPAAYVFDESGRLVEWWGDIGDEDNYGKIWSLPQDESSVEELRRLRVERAL